MAALDRREKKVLVLCQRKTDLYHHELVNDLIHALSENVLKTNVLDINYVSNISEFRTSPMYSRNDDGIVDYDGVFGDNQWTYDHFEQNSYDLIILNTCPLQYIKIDAIYKFLKTGGILALTLYRHNVPKKYVSANELKTKGYVLDQYSQLYDEITIEGVHDAILYQKKTKGGKRTKRRRKKRSLKY